MSKIQKNSTRAFKKLIWQHYSDHGRDFPWRQTSLPYRIVVSEIMLQQTQTDRVVAFYREFLREFPSFRALSKAPLARVLSCWQGLGYNRRARFLRELAIEVVTTYKGRLPRNREQLLSLPGIGSYTASAICVFAYNQPYPLIETNIRSVYIDYFFKGRVDIHDRELWPFIEQTLDRENPREWFYALMDYGSSLKRRDRSVNKRSAHYVRQSQFEGSQRQVRGRIIRLLLTNVTLAPAALAKHLSCSAEVLKMVLEGLTRDGLVVRTQGSYRLA